MFTSTRPAALLSAGLLAAVIGIAAPATVSVQPAAYAATTADAGEHSHLKHPELYDPCHLDRIVHDLRAKYGPRVNVMVYKGSARKYRKFHHVVSAKRWEGGVCGINSGALVPYAWRVFHGGGTFVRQGDGGYRNWAYYGRLSRKHDVHLRFHAYR